MAGNDRVDFVLQLLNERHRTFIERMDHLIQMIAIRPPDQRIEACKSALAALETLQSTIPKTNQPEWMGNLFTYLNHTSNNPGIAESANMLMRAIIDNYPMARQQNWSFPKSGEVDSVDFDQIYSRFYFDSAIPRLFEELVRQLQHVVDSGEVDSIKMLKDLERIIASIKKSMKGSYFAATVSWEFAGALIKNCLWEYLELIPAVGPMLKGVRKTMDDINTEMANVHHKMREEIHNAFRADIPSLEYRPIALPPMETNDGIRSPLDNSPGLKLA